MARPYVILNAAMTLDGKIATVAGDSRISCEEDLNRTHELRANVDAVMVGVGTVLADDPSLTVRRVRGRNPIRVIVDSLAKTPSDAKVLDPSAQTIVAVSKRASRENIERLRRKGALVIVGGEKEVNMPKLLEELHAMGVRKLLLEGGSTLNWSMLREGLVDEVRVAIAPRIVGGETARTLVGGPGFKSVSEGIELELISVDRLGTDILLTYHVKGCRNAQKAP
ncbi:MAG: 2,5-diamino-6-(ribosylamino)-4(3H)-pyrimidinone 5'-phosphate reductase [Hadesarchaea archaeon]|nr:2,5-diamino-6-(ribosylamino)-4(3H)-pyrimidinone 5'-phosphate reductase [Hadesarchaea archaeon]